jgi:nicotinamidase-related amidase
MKRAFGASVPQSLGEICAAERCALIIYDMQAGIVPQIADGRRIVAHCKTLLEAARVAGMRVFFTRHFFLPNQSSGVGQLRRAMIWQRKTDPAETSPLMPQGSPAWQVVPELAPLEDEVVIDKITMSAFESTFLNLALRDAQVESFIIAGIALEVGIEPTVRHGLDLNLIPVVAADACGSKTLEAFERSLATMKETGEIILCSAAEIIASLPKLERPPMRT